MHKIVLLLLIFCNIPVKTMFYLTPKWYINYKKAGHGKTIIYNIPKDIILNKIFPINDNTQLYELATLIKKFNSKKYINSALIQSILKNILPLINLSQTSKHFYKELGLNQEIKHRLSLSRVSTNTISAYLSDIGYFEERVFYLNFNNYDLVIYILLVRGTQHTNQLQVYDKKIYTKLYKLCTRIINKCDKQELKAVCEKLQEECKTVNNLSKVYINTLQDLLEENNLYTDSYLKEFLKFHDYLKLICQTSLEIRIVSQTSKPIKNIKALFLDNQNLISILTNDIIVPENVLNYVQAYESFLQTLPSLKLIISKSDESILTFQTVCGLSNESNIPINIICNEFLKIKNK